jgi:hypothetical protein
VPTFWRSAHPLNRQKKLKEDSDMKTLFYLVLLCHFLVLKTSSQTLFPLSVDNLWQYSSNDIKDPTHLSSLISEQVTMPNGKIYSHFSYFPFESNYFRQQDSIVYAYFLNDTSEHILFNYAASPGDTISRFFSLRFSTEARIILESRRFDVGYNRLVWRFFLDIGYEFITWTIADSLGLVSFLGEPSPNYSAYGVRIDGIVKYGFITTVTHQSKSPIQEFILNQNYPNPFNPTTNFQFNLSKPCYITLRIYNMLGQELAVISKGLFSAGTHSITWNAAGFSSGIYFYCLETSSYKETKKMLLLK